jgi:hypothetical protein
VSSSYNDKQDQISFILDSGATLHTCYKKELFNNINSTTTSIKWGNTNSTIRASGVGDISLVSTSANNKVTLKNVLYVPEIGVNLLSLSLISSKSYSLSLNKQNCYIYTPNNTLLAKGNYKEGVNMFSAISSKVSNYKDSNKPIATWNAFNLEELDNSLDSDLDLVDPNKEDNSSLDLNSKKDLTTNSNLDNDIDLDKDIDPESILECNLELESSSSKRYKIVFNRNTIELAHKRLGHINLKAIKELKDNTKGVKIDLKDINTASTSLDNCITCIQAKLIKNRNTLPSIKVTNYLDLIYIDIGVL